MKRVSTAPQDLKEFISILERRNDLVRVDGVDSEIEIGTLNELMAEKQGPALLFDNIKGYPAGFSVAANILHRADRQKIAFGIPEEISDLEAVRYWKEKWNKYVPVPPVVVDRGPVLDNVMAGGDIDILKFPSPKWHEFDGGKYIGTGVVTITRDPSEGWINLGTYRVMVHDKKTLSFYASPGKHATIMREKYWSQGKEWPVVMCFGCQPLVFGSATMGMPWGSAELDLVGHMQGRPVEVIIGKETGLPIPASAELAIEGFSPPPTVDGRPEGPFGEWTGYYASGKRDEPVVHIKRVYFRNDPIIHGQPPVKPPVNSFYPIPVHTASILWTGLEKAGMQGIKGVYVHGPGGRLLGVISLKQRHLGHAKNVASLAGALLSGGAGTGRYIITVDDDIDAGNLDEVLWAICTRTDPETSIDIVPGFLSSPLDPMISPEKRERRDFTTAKVFINACRPYHWKDAFPPINVASSEAREKVLKKFATLFRSREKEKGIGK